MPEQFEDPIAEAKPKASLWRRVCAWTVIVGLYAAILGMVGFAVSLVRDSFKSGTAVGDRVFLLLGAAALLAIPFSVARVYVRTRWATGRWLMSKQERVQRLSQCAMRRPGARATPPWSWIQFAANWANYSAMESSLPLWRRATGWILLVAFAALVLAVSAFGVIAMGAGLDTIHSGGLMMVGIGALVLLIPGMIGWSLVRRFRRTGSIHVTQEELRQMSEQISEGQAREWQKPLREKILATVSVTAILAVWRSWMEYRHSRGHHQNWVTFGMWTLFAIYSTWNLFRKPKTSRPPI
jgi:hypothetical protein